MEEDPVAPAPGPEKAPGEARSIDDDLIRRAASGEAAALEALYLGSIRFVRAILRDRESRNLALWGSIVTDDFPHEVLSRVFGRNASNLPRFATFDKPAAGYLKTLEKTVHRRVISQHRRWIARESRHVQATKTGGSVLDLLSGSPSNPAGTSPDEVAAAFELAELINGVARETLSEGDFDLIRREAQGIPRCRLAESLGISEKTLNTRICRARSRLWTAVKRLPEFKGYEG